MWVAASQQEGGGGGGVTVQCFMNTSSELLTQGKYSVNSITSDWVELNINCLYSHRVWTEHCPNNLTNQTLQERNAHFMKCAEFAFNCTSLQ